VFAVKEQLVTVGLLPPLNIPPPVAFTPSAVFRLNLQLVTVGVLPRPLYIPPPPTDSPIAEFSLNVQLVTVALPELNMPPPLTPAFPLNVQLVTVGLLPAFRIPAPSALKPPVIVNPSSTEKVPSPLSHVTTVPIP